MFGVAIGLLAISLGAACSLKSEEAPEDGTTTAATTASKAATAPEKAASAEPAKSGGDGDFAALFGKYKNAEFKIDYEMVVTGPGAMTGAMTIRQAGGKVRMDFTTPQGSFMLIQAGDKSYMCMTDQKICLDAGAFGAGGPDGGPVMGAVYDFNTNAANYTTRQIDSRAIAGVRATCFEVTNTKTEKSLACVGPEGQMLLGEFSSGVVTAKITATKVEGKPPATDFDSPYPVTSLSGLGGAGGFPGGLPTPPAR